MTSTLLELPEDVAPDSCRVGACARFLLSVHCIRTRPRRIWDALVVASVPLAYDSRLDERSDTHLCTPSQRRQSGSLRPVAWRRLSRSDTAAEAARPTLSLLMLSSIAPRAAPSLSDPWFRSRSPDRIGNTAEPDLGPGRDRRPLQTLQGLSPSMTATYATGIPHKRGSRRCAPSESPFRESLVTRHP